MKMMPLVLIITLMQLLLNINLGECSRLTFVLRAVKACKRNIKNKNVTAIEIVKQDKGSGWVGGLQHD
ncbi:hypothetical protein RCL_jg5065.t1 [Rhizophagus clarus]|uniref:Secreted protein n=1 Tax=Rhizophagus clarus TaxID=94130 RepID=A0A8H3L8Z4_9GLOM|nr:hypothetical protein RCL_jg5065.t1 [Rhizophagus clarus]